MMMMMLLLGLWALVLPSGEPPTPVDHETGHWLSPLEAVGAIDGTEVQGEVRVYVPAGYESSDASKKYPLVLALHGWNHSPAMFVKKGGLGELADKHQVVVAVPKMGRSIFETSFYRRTKSKWTKAPGARWVGEVVLPWLRSNLKVSGDKRQTAVLGYSAGGRGAFLLAALYPEFGFVGSVSGTYDLMALDPKSGEYRIHAAIYGARDEFPQRWIKDNAMAQVHLDKLAGLHMYVGHGELDKAVPIEQMALFEAASKKIGFASQVFVTTKGGGHDWALWNAHWPAMFEGFSRSMAGPQKQACLTGHGAACRGTRVALVAIGGAAAWACVVAARVAVTWVPWDGAVLAVTPGSAVRLSPSPTHEPELIMLLSPVFALALSILGDVPDARAARLAALKVDPAVACYEVAPGRKSTPVRENFLTYSDVVAELRRGQVAFGVRVAGENKVLVVVPDASTEIGIARHTFLKQVDKGRCEGERMFAPSFDALLGGGEPLPGVAASPRVDDGEGKLLHQGCYAATGDVSFKAVDDAKVKVAKGEVFFGGDATDTGRVSPKLKVLDPTSGEVRGLIGRAKLERVPLSRCAGLK